MPSSALCSQICREAPVYSERGFTAWARIMNPVRLDADRPRVGTEQLPLFLEIMPSPGQLRPAGILEIAGAEAIAAERRIAAQQNLAVPYLRLLGLLKRKMRVDVGAALGRERPRPGV